jgi:hypothetical protein
MRGTANFHPEWGYLVPAPSFIRTARVVLIATAVGATVGAGAVFSWGSHQATETSVAVRTLVRPVEAVSARTETSAQATPGNGVSLTEKRSLTVNSRSVDGAANEPSASSTTQVPARIAALAEAAATTEGPSTAALAAPPTAAKNPVLNVAPVKKKAMKKSNVASRFARRDEPLGLAPGEYSRSRSWGGYYGDGGGRRSENW